jgi:hypothetical protein
MPEFQISKKFPDFPQMEEVVAYAHEFKLPPETKVYFGTLTSSGYEVTYVWEEEIPDELQ